MQEDKKRFLLDNNLIHTLSHLSNDKAGELFKHILAYVNNQDPTSEDVVINLAFEPIKQDLIKDFHIRKKRSKARYDSIESNKNQQSSTKVNKSQQKLTKVNKTQQKKLLAEENNKYIEIVDGFNSICKNLSRASVTEHRIKLIDKILLIYTPEQIRLVFDNTAASDYLNGRIDKWRANLDWLLNIKNFVKVLEGNYNNVKPTNSVSNTFADDWDRVSNAVDEFYSNEK